MLKHIVMWKLQEFAEGKSRKENALYIKSRLEALKEKIPQIRFIEVGVNINPSEMAYDAILYSEFNNEEELEIYQKHPEHKKVSEYVAKVREGRVVGDYIV